MTRPFSVTVTKKDIADEIYIVILQYETRFPYTGEAIEPQWEVVYSLSEKYYLTMGEDYTVAYSGNINAGTATATYTGIGDYYTGTRTVEFTIQPQAATLNVSSTERTWSKDMSLDESDLRALFTVNDAGDTVLSGDKYTIAVTQNGAEVTLPIVSAGEYTVKVTLTTGNYAGTRLLFFDIVPPRAEEEEKPSGGSTGNGGGETAETTGEAQQDRLVVDENGQAMPYTYSTVEGLDEETGAVIARKLVIVADPVRDETGAIVYDADGQPLYEARALLLSRELLDAIAERGYTHIRFMVKDAALEWPLASMAGDSYIVHLAPLEEEEWNEREIAAVEGIPVLSQGYRAQIATVMDGEETDVTKDVLELKALLLAEAVSLAPEGREENLLLVPLEETVESSLSPANWVEATETEPARFEALLTDSGLFAMVGEQ